MQNKKRISLIISMFAVLSFAGLGYAAQEGAATLEELLAQCKSADSMGAQMPLMHPDDRPIIGFLLHSAGEMISSSLEPIGLPEEEEAKSAFLEQLNADFEAINKRHGLKEPPAGDRPEDAAGMAALAAQWFDGVDVIAYVSEAEQWLIETFGPGAMEGFTPDFSQLENLEVEEDRATANIRSRKFTFVLEGETWFFRIHL